MIGPEHLTDKCSTKLDTHHEVALVLARWRNMMRPHTMNTNPQINERLQALGRMVIQQDLEAFKRLADV